MVFQETATKDTAFGHMTEVPRDSKTKFHVLYYLVWFMNKRAPDTILGILIQHSDIGRKTGNALAYVDFKEKST